LPRYANTITTGYDSAGEKSSAGTCSGGQYVPGSVIPVSSPRPLGWPSSPWPSRPPTKPGYPEPLKPELWS